MIVSTRGTDKSTELSLTDVRQLVYALAYRAHTLAARHIQLWEEAQVAWEAYQESLKDPKFKAMRDLQTGDHTGMDREEFWAAMFAEDENPAYVTHDELFREAYNAYPHAVTACVVGRLLAEKLDQSEYWGDLTESEGLLEVNERYDRPEQLSKWKAQARERRRQMFKPPGWPSLEEEGYQ